MKDKYLVYCDESDRAGYKYCYFLGMIIIKNGDYDYIENILINAKDGYPSELKWSKIKDSNWKIKIYKNFIDAIFELIENEYIKCRISFVPKIYNKSYNNEELSFLIYMKDFYLRI